MLLAVDIGNTNIVFGIHTYEEGFQKYNLRMESNLAWPVEKYGLDLSNYLLESDLPTDNIKEIVIGSVVPQLSHIITDMLAKVVGIEPLLITPEVFAKIELEVPNHYEIGADLVANAVAAYERQQSNCIVVDFGTALTFTVVKKPGIIDGVTIAPGLKTAMESLSSKTAKLPQVPLELPDEVVGKNTIHAMQSGIMYGYQGLIEKIIMLMKEEIGEGVHILATGGLSRSIEPLHSAFDEIDQHLTLDGLRIMYQQISADLN